MPACAAPAQAQGQAQAHGRATAHGGGAPQPRKTRGRPRRTHGPQATAAKPPAASDRVGLGATEQLTAMRVAIGAAGSYFAGRATGCAAVTPVLAAEPGSVIAGNFRDSDGNCYVWLNLEQSSLLTGPEICKVALHETGHLAGLVHSADPADVMYAPFEADPIPDVCRGAAQ